MEGFLGRILNNILF